MPKVSIVTSVYNRAEHMKASISSMLNQEYDDFEVVVIDDGSKDSTLKVLKSIKDKRLKIIAQENTGFTRAVKTAIEASTGEYIAFVDGGDICFPNRIQVQADYLDAHPNVGAVGSYVELLEERTGGREVVKLEAGANPKETLLKKSIFWHGEVMYRRDLYDRVGGYRPVFYYSQDNDLWLRMSEHAELATIPQVLQTIIKFDNGITTTPQKFAIARCYRAFAVFCAKERRAGRVDPVEKFGVSSLMLRPRSATVAGKIAEDGFKQVMRGNKVVGLWMVTFALNEKITLKSLFYYVAARLPLVHTARNVVIKLLRKGK